MRVKRTLVIAGIVLVALMGLAFIGLKVWLRVLAIDEEPPDDSELLVQPVKVADDLNAFHWLREAADGAVVPWEMTEEEDAAAMRKTNEELRKLGFRGMLEEDSEKTGGQDTETLKDEDAGEEAHEQGARARYEVAEERLFDIISGNEWDEAFARDVLDTNEPVFENWQRAVSCDAIQVPWLLSMKDGCQITERLERLLRLKGACHLHSGEPGQARDLALEMIRMGYRWQGGHGSLPGGYWHGYALKSGGVSLLEMWASKAGPDSQDLRNVAKRLIDYEADGQAVQYALRVGYTVETYTLEGLLQGEITLADIGPVEFSVNGSKRTWPQERLRPGWGFRPNETRRRMAEWYRTLIQGVQGPYARFRPPSLPKKQKGCLDVLREGNTVGLMVCYALLPPGKNSVLDKCRENTWMRAVRCLFALQAYRQDAGRLPADWNQLVPEYLQEVPLDDFDGKPLRYNSKKRVIYSVGKDLRDDGGMTQKEIDDWWKQEEPWEAERGYEPPFWDLPDPSWSIDF